MRTQVGEQIHDFNKNRIAAEELFMLQWDGKMLSGLQHASENEEHVAVILHSLKDHKDDIILCITVKWRTKYSKK